MAKLLIVDDEKNIRAHLTTFFESIGHQVAAADSGRQALALLARQDGFDLVLTDYRMAEMNGLELLQQLKRQLPGAAVILMTAYATVESAVAAMKAGAFDYVTKPFTLDQIGHAVERALEVQSLRAENRILRDTLEERPLLDSRSLAMRRLLESELFGHVRGAFTGAVKDKPGRLEAADGGTVFLDEIADLSPPLQTKFLRFVQEQSFERVGGDKTISVDARIIAAS